MGRTEFLAEPTAKQTNTQTNEPTAKQMNSKTNEQQNKQTSKEKYTKKN